MAKSADAFRTISEVAEWLGVQTHVLRFWESKFTQVKPVKRAGGRRYYRPADMLLLGGIRKLLHEDGLTIKGVQKILREEGMAHVADLSPPLDAETDAQLDADLTARIVEDVAPPPTEAEIVPFAPTPDPIVEEASDPNDADTAEPETENAGPAASEPTLPSFLTAPSQDAPAEETDPAPELPYPPLQEDLPAAADEPTVEDDRPAFTADVGLAPSEGDAPASTTGDASAPETAEDVPDEAAEPALPSFMRTDKPAPVADTAPGAEPEMDAAAAPATEPEADAPAPSALPSFLSDLAPDAETDGSATVEDTDAGATPDAEADAFDAAQRADTGPTPDAEPDGPDAAEHADAEATPDALDTTPAAQAPVPRVVDVPDDPDPDSIAVAPSALTKAAQVTHLTDAQRTMIRPLLAQLTTLRDQMASTRRTPR